MPYRSLGGDGALGSHIYGTRLGEENALILFNTEGHYAPHLYRDDPRYRHEVTQGLPEVSTNNGTPRVQQVETLEEFLKHGADNAQ